MSLDMALSVFGIVATALLLGFIGGGIHERARAEEIVALGVSAEGVSAEGVSVEPETTVRPRIPVLTIGLIVMFLGCCLRLVDPSVIAPLWLQYLLLAGLPASAGYGARRMLAARLSSAS
ncbi:hypothetical protein BJQ94_13920 [Cryobacterium sp. SO2]|uniref:hypothetical protein n=1 Tax=Cryobacterium sp. SO2 TaxID=1897060 RepID=UPI0023DC7449|nr:hypothetical protein [Cryobacterium sp. SO2]WEO76456.1 hypothetical protein BJQ94_13920 [Cryobacterium sp. SO2]